MACHFLNNKICISCEPEKPTLMFFRMPEKPTMKAKLNICVKLPQLHLGLKRNPPWNKSFNTSTEVYSKVKEKQSSDQGNSV